MTAFVGPYIIHSTAAWVLPNAHSWAHLQCVRTLSKMAQVYPQPPVKDRITKILCRLLWKAASWRTDQARIETVPFNSLQTMSAEVIIALGAIQDTTSLPLVRWYARHDEGKSL